MPQTQKSANLRDQDIKIKVKKSSLTEFTKRPLPTDEELEEFDDFVDEGVRDEEIEESLNEIYQDEDGKVVDVKTLAIKKKRGFLFWFFSLIFLAAVIGGGYYLYNFYLKSGSDATAVDFSIESENEIIAGKEFYYVINYKNLSSANLKDAKITLTYPGNFVFLDSSPEHVAEKNNVWDIGSISPNYNGKIKIKGIIIGEEGGSGSLLATLTYTPENFSSEFKKETSATTIVKDTGMQIDFDYAANALLNEENEILVRFNAKENNYINNFRITFDPQDNIEIISDNKNKVENEANYSILRPGVWQINEVPKEEKIIPIRFKFTEKKDDNQEVVLKFEYMGSDSQYFTFLEKKINFEVMKNDLNLALIINGSRDDKGVDFGETLNYSIVYNNRGETSMKDVIIMAVLEGDFLDWSTLKDNLGGSVKGNTITWSKQEIPDFADLAKYKEGTIDFSIKLFDKTKISSLKDYAIKSSVYFNIGKTDSAPTEANNRSNVIVNKINSDISLSEQIRYFNMENIPVGTGPHPPVVGEKTTYKVYWTLTNSLHEMENLEVVLKLPEYISWDDKKNASVGDVSYNTESREVVWRIGRLPVSVTEANAEFSIAVTPRDEDRNRIMVLLPGSTVSATDKETGTLIKKDTKAKTTRLEDDDIASGSGIVQ